MPAYELRTDANNFRAYVVVDASDFQVLDQVHGEAIADRWQPPRMEIAREIKSNLRAPPGDFPCIFINHAPAMSQRAVDALRDLLEPVGEFLPLECELEPLWLYNCTRTIDLLDEAASDLDRFSSSGRIMQVRRHAWRSEVEHETCFRLPQFRRSSVYVTDVVVERMRSAGLLGYALRE